MVEHPRIVNIRKYPPELLFPFMSNYCPPVSSVFVLTNAHYVAQI